MAGNLPRAVLVCSGPVEATRAHFALSLLMLSAQVCAGISLCTDICDSRTFTAP